MSTSYTRNEHYVNGEWVRPVATETIDVIDPATEDVIGSVPAGNAADVEVAVGAARAAFDAWSMTESATRAAALRQIADGLAARSDGLAHLITPERGCPLKTGGGLQVQYASEGFRSMARVLDEASWGEPMHGFVVSREPYGVVAAITPWNFPLDQIVGKVAPALAAGCTVVLKPSE